MARTDLPIFELEASIVEALSAQSRLVLQAPTGSGKSTQVPQILLDHGLLGDGQVVLLQPRRLAARMLAARVASERNVKLGQEVGYQIRFENVTSKATRIRFVTEGILLRQLIADPELRNVSAILFDEFHERHLYGDITLARALQLQEKTRPNLKIAVMSATLDAGNVEQYLSPCRLLTSSGRAHPVSIEYLEKPVSSDRYPIWDLAADELTTIAPRSDGDVLIFMPGKYEIGRTIAAIRASRVSDQFVALPLHGELQPNEQDAAFAASSKRKAIVATNVAETSLTIDGVRVVIDAGLARIARYDARRGLNTLLIENISRASADQRAGRAGRTAPGKCIRLWTEREHLERPAQELPEVRRLDLAEIVLTLKASGVEDVAAFRWFEPPEERALQRAEHLLLDLGALSGKAITPLGRQMLAFPVHPRYARMFLAAQALGCVRAIALIAAITQGRPLFRRAEGKQMREDRDDLLGNETDSDLFVLMRAFRFAQNNQFDPRRCARLGVNAPAAREAAQLAEQFVSIARAEGLDTETTAEPKPDALQRCVLAGFPDEVAMRLDAGTLRCAIVHGRHGVLARESAAQDARLLVASEVREIETSDKERTVLLTLATRIEEDWLRELFPEAFHEEVTVEFDATQRRVVSRRLTRFHDLPLRNEPSLEVPREAAAALLARQVLAGTLVLKKWDHEVEQWIERVNCVADWFPEYEFPRIGEPEKLSLLEQICFGASSYKEIKERRAWPTVKAWLSATQLSALEQIAPERLKLPTGRMPKITYRVGAPPTLSARIQQLYGVERNLTIGGGRVPLRIEVLAPNHRPIQITDDLTNFWRETYPKIKKELQRKYPKHEWR